MVVEFGLCLQQQYGAGQSYGQPYYAGQMGYWYHQGYQQAMTQQTGAYMQPYMQQGYGYQG